MVQTVDSVAASAVADLRAEGLYKPERRIVSPQGARVEVREDGASRRYLNLCANNYLGLADHPELIAASKAAMDTHGLGMASVRFICGTSDLHQDLESAVAKFVKADAAILYSSCFDANTGLFETLLSDEDAIISDALNHASIIDGVRLCKARRYRYANNDMGELEAALEQSQDARLRLVATDGVFSMDGIVANLPAICDLADRYDATVMVDDSHAAGVMGQTGSGTVEHCGVTGRVGIITGTFGKALGGASGGFTAASEAVVDLLRQRSRPYLFSNALAPGICAATLAALDLLERHPELVAKVHTNAAYFRSRMSAAGFTLTGAGHPIVPVLLGEADLAVRFAAALADRGVFVTAFSFPVVPRGQARIRTQMSAAHDEADLDFAVDAFIEVGRDLGLVS